MTTGQAEIDAYTQDLFDSFGIVGNDCRTNPLSNVEANRHALVSEVGVPVKPTMGPTEADPDKAGAVEAAIMGPVDVAKPDQPLLFLDVDGVLNDLEAVIGLAMTDEPERSALADRLDVEVFVVEGFRVAVPRYMPELVQELERRTEVWWCTTWRRHANGELADYLGVGPFPVLDPDGTGNTTDWKPASVRPHADAALEAGRTVIWIEDFNGALPDLDGVHYVDTGERGVLRWSDLPVHLLE